MAKAAAIASPTLDSDLGRFRADLAQACDAVVRLHQSFDEARLAPANSWRDIAALFAEPLPQEPQVMEAILAEVEERVFANSTLYQPPRFFGYINASGNQAGIIGDFLASALNQLCAKYHFAPAASAVEHRVLRWLAEFIGVDTAGGGCFLSGGSAGNMVGLALARGHTAGFDVAASGMAAGPRLTVYASQETHASVEKGMALLGMGRSQLRKIRVLHDFTIDLRALKHEVAADRDNGYRPICVIGNGGTTNTGAVDPLDALADFCDAENLWFHIDAAYGGPAAGTAVAGHLFRGIERADSVVVNPHKWLYVPAEASCILVREPRMLRETFSVAAAYLRAEPEAAEGPIDFKDLGPQLSRGFRALKVWMTFKAYGAVKLRAAIEGNIQLMQYLAEQIDRSADFVRLAPVPLSIVCFQYRPNALGRGGDRRVDEINARLPDALEQDGRVFLSATTIDGRKVLRACSVNHRMRREHVDLLLDVIREVGQSLMRSSG